MKYIALGCLLLIGCGSRQMTNMEIVEQVKFCEEHGLKPDIVWNGWTYEIVRVQCILKDQK